MKGVLFAILLLCIITLSNCQPNLCPNPRPLYQCAYCECEGLWGKAYQCKSLPNNCCWGNLWWQRVTVQQQVCGDGINQCEGCDDGNTVNGDGCSSNCEVETGWQCGLTFNATSSHYNQIDICHPVCSQGCDHGTCVGVDECACDEGYSGPACNMHQGATVCESPDECAHCACGSLFGSSYTCTQLPEGAGPWTPVERLCGNGLAECEPCDDGNTINGDGCSSNCEVEQGWTCALQKNATTGYYEQISICTPLCNISCGPHGSCSGPNECACEEGFAGPRCEYVVGASLCTNPNHVCAYCLCAALFGSGYGCTTLPNNNCCWSSAQWAPANQWCGDGQAACEPCDDGNNINGDGCSSNCEIEAGWTCTIQFDSGTGYYNQTSVCTPIV